MSDESAIGQIHQSQLLALMKAKLNEKMEIAQRLHSELKDVQDAISHYQGVIADLTNEGLTVATDEKLSAREEHVSLPPNQTPTVVSSDLHESEPSKRSPVEMMRHEYKQIFDSPDHKLRDVIFYAIEKLGKPANTKELTRLIYDTQSSEEFDRARNSLSAELRAELKRDAREQPLWQKLNRNTYAPANWKPPISRQMLDRSDLEASRFAESAASSAMLDLNGQSI